MRSRSALPDITIGTRDYNRLMLTAIIGREMGHPYAECLLSELRRATLSRQDDVPRDVVSLDSRVTYRVDGAAHKRTRLLVHPQDLGRPGAEIGATTPLGIALLGMSPGDRMPYRGRGDTHEVVVEAVRLGLHEIGIRAAASSSPRAHCKRPTHELHEAPPQPAAPPFFNL